MSNSKEESASASKSTMDVSVLANLGDSLASLTQLIKGLDKRDQSFSKGDILAQLKEVQYNGTEDAARFYAFEINVRHVFKISKLSDNAFLSLIHAAFSGPVSLWWLETDPRPTSVDEVLKLIKERFCEKIHAERFLEDFRNRSQGSEENIVVYVETLERLERMGNLTITKSEWASRLRTGVLPSYWDSINDDVSGWDKARIIAHCKLVEERKRLQTLYKPPPKPSQMNIKSLAYPSRSEGNFRSIQPHVTSSGHRMENPGYAESARLNGNRYPIMHRRTGRCFHCQSAHHLIRNCPEIVRRDRPVSDQSNAAGYPPVSGN
jgi:hypothetical protein